MVSALTLAGGCRNLLDPSDVSGARPRMNEPLTVSILDTIDPALETPEYDYDNATEVKPQDLRSSGTDYGVSPNDLLSISISDLQGLGVETTLQKRVAQSGNISLPQIGTIPVAGLTEAELETQINQAYREAQQIQNAQVSVAVVEARGRAFSVLGAVQRPNQYAIVDSDFRVLDALVLAGGTTSPLNDVLYVIRRLDERTPAASREGATDGMRPATNPGGTTRPRTTPPAGEPGADDLAPRGPRSDAGAGDGVIRANAVVHLFQAADQDDQVVLAQAQQDPDRRVLLDGREIPARRPATDASRSTASGRAATTMQPTPSAEDFEFNDLEPAPDVRVIRIPLAELKRGELRYNIVIQPRDTIIVPDLPSGFYYMGGHVNRPGAYSLNGQKVTIKEAVIAASMLDPLAVPHRTDLIRRIGPDKEVYVRVDLTKIFAGTQSDIYLKANDKLVVGTDMIAPFLFSLRNAFRFTYGAGFIYDRNFAYNTDFAGRSSR